MSCNTLVLNAQAAVARHCPAYYFDFIHVYGRCDSLRQYPERVALMCQNRVRTIAPGRLMLPRKQSFFLIVQTRLGAAADALASVVLI